MSFFVIFLIFEAATALGSLQIVIIAILLTGDTLAAVEKRRVFRTSFAWSRGFVGAKQTADIAFWAL